MTQDDHERVLRFWFGELDEHGCAAAEARKRWWTKDPAFDQRIRDEFEADYEAIVAGERAGWRDSARGRLASIVVLDQFSRNMFRNTPKMYAADPLAQKLVLDTIEQRLDQTLATDERVFCYMPLMHSEELEHQDRCVAIFAALCDEVAPEVREQVANNHGYAVSHRDIVADWGRFPHRNSILGRDSTAEELEFLKKPGSSF